MQLRVLQLGWCSGFFFESLQNTFPHLRDENIEVKVVCKYQLDLSCSMSYVDMFLGNGDQLSVFGEWPSVLASDQAVQRFIQHPHPCPTVLHGYKRWPFETPYPPLLGVLTRITLTDSRKFPLYQLSPPCPKCSQFQLSLPSFSSSIIFPYTRSPPAPVSTSSHTHSISQIYSVSPFQEDPCIYLLSLLYLISLGLCIVPR